MTVRVFKARSRTASVLALGASTLACSLVGCIDTGEAPAPAEAQVDQAATLSQNPFGITWFGGHQEWDMGTSANQTCFVTGVRGDLSGDPYDVGTTHIAEVGTVMKNGHWFLVANAGIGTGVEFTALCITNVTNRVQMSVSECKSFGCIAPSVPGAPNFPNRRCFLTDIWSRAGMTFHYQGDSTPGLHVTKNAGDGRYYLQMWSSNDAAEPANMGGTVTCVDIAGDAPGSWTGSVSELHVCSGSVTRGFLTGVFGDFNGSTSDGVWMTNDLNGGASVSTTNGKTAEFDCVW